MYHIMGGCQYNYVYKKVLTSIKLEGKFKLSKTKREIRMAKLTYDYQLVQCPEVAKESFDALYKELSKETKLRKGDLWLAMVKAFAWLPEEQQQNHLKDIGVEMYNNK